ncbi:NOT5 protein (NOT5) [Trypanosoma rangeli SC58]|uniref:NOT5 protein (NOT5) n=1 Tax=Trypanosoma rangeli SC58 TaxID=429131 RepID=A0A061J599_TRYRA|nr:NOT5 protein (NOT5) [Trypanosoma rangeli SC58]
MENARKQMEIIEYDVEHNTRGHHGRGKGAGSAEAVRLQRLQFHLGKLEQLLKSATNGDVDLDEVADIEERVWRFLLNETNSDEDDDDETIYCGFDLEDNHYEKSRGSGAEADDAATQDARKKSMTSSPTTTRASSQSAVKKTMASLTVGKVETAKRSARAPTTTASRAGGTSPTAAARAPAGGDTSPEAWEDSAGLLDDEMDKANTDTFGDDAMDIKSSWFFSRYGEGNKHFLASG